MTRKRSMIALAAVAAGLFAWRLAAAPSTGGATAASDTRMKALELQVRGLAEQARVERHRGNQLVARLRLAATESAPVPGAVVAADDDSPVDSAVDTTADLSPPVPLETALAEEFAAESEDGDWSASAATRAVEALGPVLPEGSSLKSVDCRSSLCRIEIAHADGAGHEQFIGALMSGRPMWEGPGSYSRATGPDGREMTVAFLGRIGSDEESGSVWSPDNG